MYRAPLGFPAHTSAIVPVFPALSMATGDRKSTRLNSSHSQISYAVFCLKKKKKTSNLVKSCRLALMTIHTDTGPLHDVSPRSFSAEFIESDQSSIVLLTLISMCISRHRS